MSQTFARPMTEEEKKLPYNALYRVKSQDGQLEVTYRVRVNTPWETSDREQLKAAMATNQKR